MSHLCRTAVPAPVKHLFRWLGFFVCGLAVFADTTQAPVDKDAVERGVPVFSVETAMVVVDAVVRDRRGNLIESLGREDFRVYEDNVLQEIVTFSAEKVPVGPPAETVMPENGEPRVFSPVVNLGLEPERGGREERLAGKRLIILFFDLSSLDAETLIRSMDAAGEFLSSQTGPQDLVAIATYSSTLSLVQDLTNDRDLLLGALRAMGADGSIDSGTEITSDSAASEDVFIPDSIQFDIFNTDRRLSALETLAKMYREFPERKSLIYFSGGVTTTGVENNAQIRSTVDSANRANMSIYTVDGRGLIALPPGGDASQGMRGSAMLRGASMARQRSDLFASQETLVSIANDTGGKSFSDINDLGMAMKQVLEDTAVYYVLGYVSANRNKDGRFRRIRVELVPSGLRVEHRRGYFAEKTFDRMTREERDLQLQQAMAMDKPFVNVPLILKTDFFRRDDATAYVPVSIRLAGDGLAFEQKGSNRESRFEFVAQAVDSAGKVTGIARDSVQVRLPAERAEKIREGGFFYATGFQLQPGEYQLKFLVRDNINGNLGTFEQPIQVPAFDLKKLSLSSIVLGSRLAPVQGEDDSFVSRQGAMRKYQAMRAEYDPLVIGNEKVVPSIGNVFYSRQSVLVYFHVYGAGEDSETMAPLIRTSLMLIRDNRKILETQPQYVEEWNRGAGGPRFGPAKRPGGMPGGGDFPGRPGGPFGAPAAEERKGEATVAISLPLRDLQKGVYTLQIHVRDEIAGANHFERVPLVIR
ncbi:MAG TPA: VWA domain-containing protein [Acidobacteriota bacterium]|nr:VWA domain-containing protein [Acidobacteriota bacterium]